jgi:hypothetical protein
MTAPPRVIIPGRLAFLGFWECTQPRTMYHDQKKLPIYEMGSLICELGKRSTF